MRETPKNEKALRRINALITRIEAFSPKRVAFSTISRITLERWICELKRLKQEIEEID